MEDIKKAIGFLTLKEEEEEEEESDEAYRSSVFTQLKHHTLELLELASNPNKGHSAISKMLDFLKSSSPTALQPFFDYILFPLLLLLDAAVECRSLQKINPEEKSLMLDVSKRPFKVSDCVAEGLVQCLQELLTKLCLRSVDQMVLLLKKLTFGALLSPFEASEEFREGIIKCFRAMILSLQACSDESCSCKQILDRPALSDRSFKYKKAAHDRCLKYYSEPNECLLGFLRSQSASAAVGHWLSLLLRAADVEAARGHCGSARLRVEAFTTLRVLVAKVGLADALAFFLPGVVSQFAKVLHTSKTTMSGAAGSVEAVDQAIRGLSEYLMIVLQDDTNISSLDADPISDFGLNMYRSTESYLEELRHLKTKVHGQDKEIALDDTSAKTGNTVHEKNDPRINDSGRGLGSLHVDRTKDWIKKTSANVNKLLSATFPHICVHPSVKVRQGLLAAIQGLLSKCCYSLKEIRQMLLECLCVLAVDDFEDVSTTAQEFLDYLFLQFGKLYVERDVADIFSRLLEKLPKVVLGSEESLAVSHAKQLLVIIYYSGPWIVVDHLLKSSVTAARFLDVFAACLSQNSVFSGSLDKLVSAPQSTSTGYLPSITELNLRHNFTNYDLSEINASPSEIPKLTVIQENAVKFSLDSVQKNCDLPRMPPWFVYVGSHKLYQVLAGILRLVGLSIMADFRSGGPSSLVTEILLGYFRKLISELRKKEYHKESWQAWYNRTGSGKLLRQASTAACMLNEMIFGLSDQSIDNFSRMFHKSCMEKNGILRWSYKVDHSSASPKDGVKTQLINCIGDVLHEYLSPEIWNFPMQNGYTETQLDVDVEDFSLHFIQDTIMLHEVIIDGIGICSMCLGRDFASSGFLHSSLYTLLENLSSSDYQVRKASDVVLHVQSATFGYQTVGDLVLANADYVIDSLSRQLRHLDLNPHVPHVLAALLSYIGVAYKILPLLEEPMNCVARELEILGRYQHPDLTISFLKAVVEISKASKQEASSLPTSAESHVKYVRAMISDVGKITEDSEQEHELQVQPLSQYFREWESIVFKLNDSRRYRQIIGSIARSCLTVATPLLASLNQMTCLGALDIIEDGVAALEKIEAAYKLEMESKEMIEEVLQSQSLYHLKDTLDAAEAETDENRLLPAMNKIWPFLVVCIQNKNPAAVRRCLNVVRNVVKLSGGDFFSRRFHADGMHFWKLLTLYPFHKMPKLKDSKTQLRLPYRTGSVSSEDTLAETSFIKVQVAVLNMIADLCQNKRSCTALEVVFKRVTGLVVGIACSSFAGLRDASINALEGLASIDPDLVWLLLADIYYSVNRKKSLPSSCADLPDILEVLPPPNSPKEYLYMQYGGDEHGFDVDFSSVEIVFRKLHERVFSDQMYC